MMIYRSFSIFILNKNLFDCSAYYNQESLQKMFPNDDICNVKAAKNAARRIFQKYKTSAQKQANNNGIGKQQVSSLIKNAYEAINIQFDPSTKDVFSFMSVFGANQNQSIDLDRLQQMAVKYLCGQSVIQTTLNNNQKNQKQENLEKTQTGNEQQSLNSSLKSASTNKSNILHQYQQKDRSYGQSGQLGQNKLVAPKAQKIAFLSPKYNVGKNNYFTKQVPRKDQNKNIENQNLQQKFIYSEILNEANSIFNDNKNKQKSGITIKQASEVLSKSYRLIGRSKFKPSQEDVKIWMKLCDTKKAGVIDWINYENFIKRMMERQNIYQFQQN